MKPFLNSSGRAWAVTEATSGENRKWEAGCSGRQWDEVEVNRGSRESQEGGINWGEVGGSGPNSPKPSLSLNQAHSKRFGVPRLIP